MVDDEGYRANVGIIILNHEKKVLWAKRVNEMAWQFPQGGIYPGEIPDEAMQRELMEEVGLTQNKIEIIARTKDWLRYDVPINWIRRDGQGKYRGQKQIWYLLKFVGNDKDIFLQSSNKPEFDDWMWVDYWSPVDQVIDFKRKVYQQALDELSVYL